MLNGRSFFFTENDERVIQITSRACRASYISMMYAFPIILALLVLNLLVSESVPWYPIAIFLLLPFVQVVTYFISWNRNYET